MKKLLSILPVLLLSIALSAQQTEDEVYVGKKFGAFKGAGVARAEPGSEVKPVSGPATITGTVLKVDWCEEDCRTILVKKDDGTTVTIGTKDYGFTVPKKLVGKRIMVEGIDPNNRIRERRTVRTDYQKNIQFAASGVIVIE